MTELTDLEICEKVANVEGFDIEVRTLSGYKEMPFDKIRVFAKGVYGAFFSVYNPLTDDALCFRLMVKYKISLIQHQNNTAVYCIWNHNEKHATATITNPNKAICLAIIAAHSNAR